MRVYEAPTTDPQKRTLVADVATWRAILEGHRAELRSVQAAIYYATIHEQSDTVVRLTFSLPEARIVLAATSH